MSETQFDGDALKASKYYQRFEKLGGSTTMNLKGDMMLVEKLPKIEKKTSSGIIIVSDASQYRAGHGDSDAEFGIVLMVGPGQVLEDGTLLPCDSMPGDVILLPGNVAWYSQFGHMADYEAYSIGRLRDSQVGMTFTDYKKTFEVLNEKNAV